MEINKRNLRVRKPLSDCTNTLLASSQSSASTFPSLIKPRKPKINSSVKKIVDKNDTKGQSSSTSELPARNLLPSIPNPSSDFPPPETSTPSRLPVSSSNSGTEFEFPEPQTVYKRRSTTNKRKNVEKEVVPLSFFTASKIQTNLGKENIYGYSGPSKAKTVPCKKRQRPTISGEGVSKIEFPQDFIEKQKAYFSEVDAFELPVEEAKSSDSD